MIRDKDLDPEAVTGIGHAAVEKTTLTNIIFLFFDLPLKLCYFDPFTDL